MHIFTYTSIGEALEYVLNFPHIFLCKMVNFEDVLLLRARVMYGIYMYCTEEARGRLRPRLEMPCIPSARDITISRATFALVVEIEMSIRASSIL